MSNKKITKQQKWIVTFKKKFNPKNHKWSDNFVIDNIHDHVHHGMSCTATEDCLKNPELKNIIKSYVPDTTVRIQALAERKKLTQADLTILAAQPIGPFINRVGANHSSQLSGNGTGSLAARTDINVFVVDTGIAVHSDLNIVGGRNFTTSDPNTWTDGNGHGTHVAGIIGAQDNAYGIVGAAPGVRLWAIKVLNSSGSGTISTIITGLNWILANRGIKWTGRGIVNLSLGGGISPVLDSAVNTLINNGIVVCVAAGNRGINAANASPARVANSITVGATGPISSYNTLASFSNYGPVVDILAPGTNIYSTYLNNGYATLSGTSMSCPVVSGISALVINAYPLSGDNTIAFPTNVRSIIVNNSAATTVLNKDKTIGSNPRISVPAYKQTTNISVWAGVY